MEMFPLPENTLDPEWQALLTTVIRIRRERMDRSSRSGLWNSRTDEVAFHVVNARSQPPSRLPPSGDIGESRTGPTTFAT